jgi:signal transduction histidine kinase
VRELAESVNHHLRTPLATIVGHSELLLDHRQGLSTRAQDSLAGILRAGSRLDEVVTLVCDLVELACGCPVDLEPVEVSRLVAEEVEALRDRAAERRVRLVLSDTGEVATTADPDRLRRAVRALLEKATEHAPDGSVVHATAVRTRSGVRIAVRGRGLATRDARRATTQPPDPIVPVQGATTCLGLGLALASAVASAHGGRLVLANLPGGILESRLELPSGSTSPTDAPTL